MSTEPVRKVDVDLPAEERKPGRSDEAVGGIPKGLPDFFGPQEERSEKPAAKRGRPKGIKNAYVIDVGARVLDINPLPKKVRSVRKASPEKTTKTGKVKTKAA